MMTDKPMPVQPRTVESQMIQPIPDRILLTEWKKAAMRDPDRTAYMAGKEKISYGGLWQRAEYFADLLRRQGSAPVILYGGKECAMFVLILACLLAHRAYVPVDVFTPEERAAKIVSLSGASLLIFAGSARIAVDSSSVFCCAPEELAGFAGCAPHEQVSETAYIIFTSGTTGEPKGVPISRGNLANFIGWLNRLEPLCTYGRAVVLNQASFSFDLSAADMFYALSNGHTLVAAENGTDIGAVSAVMRENAVSVCVMTPTFAKLCLLDDGFSAENIPTLSCIYFCGETLEAKVVRRLWDRFPSLAVINAYGPTEAASAVSAVRIGEDMLGEDCSARLPVGVISDAAVDIAVEDGEIVLRGASVFGGYLGGVVGGYFREDAVNGDRINDGCINGYRTGDLGEIRDGYLYCLGRKDSQIKYKGYRIELYDIERNIAALPGVRACAVTAKRSGDGTVRWIAAYAVSDDAACTAEAVRDALRSKLPGYMIPKVIRMMDALPVNANGKIDRKALEDA